MRYISVASPYELLGLFAWFLFTSVPAFYVGNYMRRRKILADYYDIKSPYHPPAWLISCGSVAMYFIMAFNGFFVWQKLVEYKINGDTENEDIDGDIGNTVIYWQYISIMFLHASTWVLGPLWFEVFLRRKMYTISFVIILSYDIVSILLTVFGYLMDWRVGLMYTLNGLWITFVTVFNGVIAIFENAEIKLDESVEEKGKSDSSNEEEDE
jgi:tryptophan-rich sensory protein